MYIISWIYFSNSAESRLLFPLYGWGKRGVEKKVTRLTKIKELAHIRCNQMFCSKTSRKQYTYSQIKKQLGGCEVIIGRPWCLNSSDLYKKLTYKASITHPTTTKSVSTKSFPSLRIRCGLQLIWGWKGCCERVKIMVWNGMRGFILSKYLNLTV